MSTETRDDPEVRGTLVLATAIADLAPLRTALGGDHVEVPDAGGDWTWSAAEALEQWRDREGGGDQVARVVVAAWPATAPARPMCDIDEAEFADRLEGTMACWLAALGVAVRRVCDGGAIVAVVERPPPLDAAGRSLESGVADAVEAWARSLARSEGSRGVRVNAVTTPGRLAPATIVAPAPSLETFPGSLDHEVADAVRMLLGPGIAGVTGTVVHADCGRSWR